MWSNTSGRVVSALALQPDECWFQTSVVFVYLQYVYTGFIQVLQFPSTVL